MSLLAADRFAPIHISLLRFSFSPEALVSVFLGNTPLAYYFYTTFYLHYHYIVVVFKYYFEITQNSELIMVTVRFERIIRKSGGSSSIAIPPEVLNALGWKVGDPVEVYAEEQKIVIKKVT